MALMFILSAVILCVFSLIYVFVMNRRLSAKVLEKTQMVKDAQAQIIHMEKMASLGVLAAGIAHEINNPLGFLVSNLESLKSYSAELEAADDKTKKIGLFMSDFKAITQESLEGALRIKRIVSDLRTFSRRSESQEVLSDINQILESVLSIVWNEIKYKASVDKKYEAASQVYVDPTQLSQVFLNLLINASQAIEKKGEIGIHTYEDKENIFVKVSDNGCGMPQEVKSKIFDPFFSTKKSTGLGLSVSYNIISHHGGDIKVESKEGFGTAFLIRLPKERKVS